MPRSPDDRTYRRGMTTVNSWLDRAVGGARTATTSVFSVEIPLNAGQGGQPQQFLSEVIEGVEQVGWALDKMSAYSSGDYTKVLLIFRRSN